MDYRLLYLYCITDNDNGFRPLREGIGGRKADFCIFGDIRVWYGEIGRTYVKRSLENLKAHNAICMDLMGYYNVLPFKFGTVVNGEGKVLDLAERLYIRVKEDLNRLTDKYEVSVRIFDKQDAAIPAVRGPGASNPGALPPSREYLVRLVKWYDDARRKRYEIEKMKDDLMEIFAPMCDESRIPAYRGGRMVVNGAFLIKKCDIDEFVKRFDSFRVERPGFSFLFSGPWPPYNFIDANN